MNQPSRAFKVAFAVTEVGPDVAAGDYFTALELGSALRRLLRWEVAWLPAPQWYDVGDANAVIAMTDHYDPTRLGARAASLIKICWMRNWFDRWAGKSHFGMWDIRLCSSLKAAAHIRAAYGYECALLRIATNHARFRPRNEEKLYDYVFTGSYWGAPRDIELIDPDAIGLRFALYGKNWEDHPRFRPYCKGFAPYRAMPRIYNQSRLLVDDANSVTKEWGSVNSRVFDALASGILVITNSATGSGELFDNRLPVYTSPEGLRGELARYLDDPELYRSTVEDLRGRVLAGHTYDIRARELAAIIHGHLRDAQAREAARVARAPAGAANPGVAPGRPPVASIIIPVFNQMHFTVTCLDVLFRNTPEPCEIIVVDNGSTDETPRLLEGYAGRIRVIRNERNEGFARACNAGAAAATAPYLLFLNNDTEVQPGWLPPLLAMAARPGVGAVGSRLLFPDGTVQHAGVVIVERRGITSLLPRHAFIGESPSLAAPEQATAMQAATAACLLVDAASFADVGGFDTGYWNGSEDVDLCFKLGQLGRKVVYEPASVVVHHEGKSGHERTVAINTNNARLRARWEGLVAPDIIDGEGVVSVGEGLARRIRAGDELAPDAAHGEALTAWWHRYRAHHLPQRPAPSRRRFAVRICTPSRHDQGWGDTAFGRDLAEALARQDNDVEVLFKDEWHARSGHDVAIHIRGVYRYYPRPGSRNVLWIISHPELVTRDELDSYDLVLCASATFLRQIGQTTSTPCHYLPQAASPLVVRNAVDVPRRLDMLFVGNNYAYKENSRRRIVQDVLDAGYGGALRVVGRDWDGYLPEEMLLERNIPQEMLPRLYGMARINLNDHHPAMVRDGFINNRTYDLGLLGQFQISNAVPGIEELGVVTYANATDLRHKVEYYLANEAARNEMAALARERCAGETFDRRAATILDLV
ncbi:glycosyltransferase family protein [Nitratidesulfovibrio sp. 1201_IL3209]|uniref:glycosyltransferase family protein n=1 Tax=Nitratidesulfovibrio sp. 1201_IL3209 TaxID=3084053 RepID=UPI002FDA82A2